MATPAPKWLGGQDDGNLRGWVISLLTVLIAALLIASIAEWAHRPAPATIEEETSH